MNNGLHHLDTRKRLYEKLERYPHPDSFKRNLDYLMYGVAVLTPLALLPQVLQVFVSKSVAGISLPTWALLGVINFLWSLYGAVHREMPILLANLLIGILDILVVVGVLLYH